MRLEKGLLLVPLLGALGCSAPEGCLGGDDGHCKPKSACEELLFQCGDDTLDVAWVNSDTAPLEGHHALFADGDLVLTNSRVRAVFDALDAPHLLAPSGGSLIDLVPAAGGADGLNLVYQAVGILPDDAVRYVSVEIDDQRPNGISLVYRGVLDIRPEFSVVTRYELRACEPGLRVRTEFHHGGRDPLTLFPADAFFWGDRGLLPFTPGQDLGFSHPDVELATLGDSFVNTRFMTAAAPGTNDAALALVRCDASLLSGFHSDTISAVGAERRIVMPGDSAAFERFIGVAAGPGHQAAIDVAAAVREQLWGEASITVSGSVADELGRPAGGDADRVSVLIRDAEAGVAPSGVGAVVASATPAADGSFAVRVPHGRRYEALVSVFGKTLGPTPVDPATLSTGTIVVPAWASVTASVTGPGNQPLVAEVVLVPADADTADEHAGSHFGQQREPQCAPYLGPPHGAAPACNRVLIDDGGSATFSVPAGDYIALATHGPFFSLAERRITLGPGDNVPLDFRLDPLDLVPAGALSADLHVHGGASFDSSLPDRDRTLSFLASDVAVIVATDHDVVSDYADAIRTLGVEDRVRVVAGVETTGHILFYRPPGSDVPKVIGHYNYWPLARDALAPRRGAPNDERLEPGALFERLRSLSTGTGVAQMNHPYADDTFGRDQGYLEAVDYDPRRNVPPSPNGTPEGELSRKTRGGTSNLDFDVQEVMNGGSVRRFHHYRAAWFSFLNQGIVRAGTANSDSHTLAIEALGYPRNLVLGQGPLSDFDQERFDDAIRNGQSFGTNGPVLEVCVRMGDGPCEPPSLTPRRAPYDAILHFEVAAAPWIPVDEARVYLNGVLTETFSAVTVPADPLGTTGTSRLVGEARLYDMAADVDGDYFVVVEAGMALPLTGDLDGDGLVDTTDNDGNGRVDSADGAGRFVEPGRVPREDPRFFVQSVAPGVLPLAFSNPFFIDRDGDGFRGPRQR